MPIDGEYEPGTWSQAAEQVARIEASGGLKGTSMGGAPCIRGLRIPVSVVVDMVADGMSNEEILDLYPDLEREDISEALRFAAEAVRERELPLASNN